MSMKISVCSIIFEVMSGNNIDTTGPSGSVTLEGEALAGQDMSILNGRREARDIKVETYAKSVKTSKPLFPQSAVASNSNSESNTRHSSAEPDVTSDEDSQLQSVQFATGNPFVETTRGILHLYKENILSTLEAGSARCDTICILAIPATMECRDLLTFTAACHQDIKHLRIIKDGTPNQYMALLTFRSQAMACEFYTSFNGVPFNSLEPECVCHLVFVSAVDVEESHPQPPPGHTELPTCPVCLERMDESVDGILTILCNHSFHSNCLAKWGDSSCPVCRYVQTPELVADNRCLECLSAENLWICLICGHVGCGRYVEGHAFKHYLTTQHCYSMQLGSNRVWDYAGDNFVHRLLQNKGDGKLVAGEQPSKEPGIDEKIDSMQLEWTYNLTSQLEKQKEYFENKISRMQQTLGSESTDLRQKLVRVTEENKQLQTSLTGTSHEKQQLEKKVSGLTTRLSTVLKQLQDERQMGKALQENQADLQNKFVLMKTEKDQELTDVKEQLRDVMFFLEAQKQIEASDSRDEIVEGRITIGESSQASQGNTRSRHRRVKQ